jgi:hypothetical protein
MRFRVMLCGIAGLVTSATLVVPALAEVESTTSEMSFPACLEVIRRTAQQLGVAPINIAETTDIRIVRFPSVDGSLLVTCSRLDGKLVLTKSSFGG